MRAVVLRDLRLAARAGGGLGLSLAFFVIVVVLVPLAVGPEPAVLRRLAPGVLWVAALLATLLTLDRLWALDAEDGALPLLLSAPLPAEALAVAKALAHWLTTGLPLALLAAPLGLLLHLDARAYVPLVAGLLLGTPALSLIGAFAASLTVVVRRGGPLLPLLVLPLYVPTLILGAEAAGRAAEGLSPATPLVLLAAVSLGALAGLPFATGAALRAALR